MTNEVIIRPIGQTKMRTPFVGEYYDKNTRTNVILTTDYRVVRNRVLNANESRFMHRFDPEVSMELAIRWEDTDADAKEKLEFIQALSQHIQIQHPDNKNASGSARFEFVDKRKLDRANASAILLRNGVVSKIRNMTASEMNDIAFFMGDNPVNKTPEQVFITLCDTPSGLCMKDPAKFLREWKLPDTSHSIVVRKAIAFEVIQKEGNVYKFNRDIIGNTVDESIAFLKANEKVYVFVKSAVAERDIRLDDLVEDILEPTKEKAKAPTKSLSEKQDNKAVKDAEKLAEKDKREKLIQRMKELNINGWQSPFIRTETMEMKIAEAETAKKETVTA